MNLTSSFSFSRITQKALEDLKINTPLHALLFYLRFSYLDVEKCKESLLELQRGQPTHAGTMSFPNLHFRQ